MEALLSDYPVVTEIPVAWGEMDALNHVNNAVYFRYFETARLDFFKHVELMEEMAITKVGPVLGDTYCKYFRPVTYPDTLMIGFGGSLIFAQQGAGTRHRSTALNTLGGLGRRDSGCGRCGFGTGQYL